MMKFNRASTHGVPSLRDWTCGHGSGGQAPRHPPNFIALLFVLKGINMESKPKHFLDAVKKSKELLESNPLFLVPFLGNYLLKPTH